MTQITISNGVTTIVMPKAKKVSDAGELIFKESTMASGKIVRDIKGFRPAFKYEWDYVPASTITSLINILRSGSSVSVNYFDVDGIDKQGVFYLSYPSFEVFKFKDGIPMWHKCSITIKSQGVL